MFILKLVAFVFSIPQKKFYCLRQLIKIYFTSPSSSLHTVVSGASKNFKQAFFISIFGEIGRISEKASTTDSFGDEGIISVRHNFTYKFSEIYQQMANSQLNSHYMVKVKLNKQIIFFKESVLISVCILFPKYTLGFYILT